MTYNPPWFAGRMKPASLRQSISAPCSPSRLAAGSSAHDVPQRAPCPCRSLRMRGALRSPSMPRDNGRQMRGNLGPIWYFRSEKGVKTDVVVGDACRVSLGSGCQPPSWSHPAGATHWAPPLGDAECPALKPHRDNWEIRANCAGIGRFSGLSLHTVGGMNRWILAGQQVYS